VLSVLRRYPQAPYALFAGSSFFFGLVVLVLELIKVYLKKEWLVILDALVPCPNLQSLTFMQKLLVPLLDVADPTLVQSGWQLEL